MVRRPRTGLSPLVAHEAVCRANPRWDLRLAAPRTPAGGRPGSPSPGSSGDADASARAETSNLSGWDRAAWERARRGFLAAVPATANGSAPFVASSAHTLLSPPLALRRAGRLLGADAVAWALRALDQPLAWLWVLLFPTLLFHHPAQAVAASYAPLTYAACTAAIFAGELSVALADRAEGVWRSAPGRAGTRSRPQYLGGGAPGTPARVTAAQRRALRLVRAGRLSSVVRALTAAPVAPRAPVVCDKARSLFPPARPGLASLKSVERSFPAELEVAASFRRASGVPSVLLREAVGDAIRRATRGSAPGPSGLRMEHLRALGDDRQAALAKFVFLLAGEEAERLVPPLAAHALAGADSLLLCKPGGLDKDGLPRLRPIGMPEVLRKLAVFSLAGTVRAAAARLLAPLQMGVGVSNPCERVVHEVTAELLHNPLVALLQLDFKNAFNLVPLAAAVAYLRSAFPLLRLSLSSVYSGCSPPRVYGWADDDSTPGAAGGLLARRWLAVQRGVQQGDPLSPLIHTAAMLFAELRLAAAHPTVLDCDVRRRLHWRFADG